MKPRVWLPIAIGLLLVAAASMVAIWPASHQGRTVNEWLALSASGDYRDRNAAEAALQALGARALPDLVAALRARDTHLGKARAWLARRVLGRTESRLTAVERRALAAAALGKLGPSALPAARALVESLADDSAQVASDARHALGRIGVGALPEIVKGLSSPSPRVRFESAFLLGLPPFDAESGSWADAMVAATRDPESQVRASAIVALSRTHHAGRVAIIEQALYDPDFGVRISAAWRLGEIGPEAVSAAPTLRKTLADPHPRVRIASAEALWRVTGDTAEAVAALGQELAAPDWDYRAAFTVAAIGQAAETVVPHLLKRLETETVHRPSRTPSPTALALGRVGPAAVPGLMALLDHPRTEVRVGAAVALRNQGTNAVAVVPKLLELVDHPDGEVRITAVDALGAIGPAGLPAVPRLRQLSQESTDYLRAAALNALERIEAPSPAATDNPPDVTAAH